MSMATLERAILAGARIVFCNNRLRNKDIQEWSSWTIEPYEGERVAFVADPGVYVAIKAEQDKRPAASGK